MMEQLIQCPVWGCGWEVTTPYPLPVEPVAAYDLLEELLTEHVESHRWIVRWFLYRRARRIMRTSS